MFTPEALGGVAHDSPEVSFREHDIARVAQGKKIAKAIRDKVAKVEQPASISADTNNDSLLQQMMGVAFDDADHDEDGVIDLDGAQKVLSSFGVAVNALDVLDMLAEVVTEGEEVTQDGENNNNVKGGADLLIDVVPPSNPSLADASITLPTDLPEAAIALQFDRDVMTKILKLWQSAAQYRMFEEVDTFVVRRIDEIRAMSYRLMVPDTAILFAWQTFVALSTVFGVIGVFMIPGYDDETLSGYFNAMTIPECFLTAVMLADIWVHLSTIAVTKTESGDDVVVDERWLVAKMWCSSIWMFVDVLAALPLRFLFSVGGDPWYEFTISNSTGLPILEGSGCVRCSTEDDYYRNIRIAMILVHLRVLKCLRLFKWFGESPVSLVDRVYVKLYYYWAGIVLGFLQVITFMLFIGWTTVWLQIDDSGIYNLQYGFWLVLNLMSGYGDVLPTNDRQRYFYCFYFLLTVGFYAVVIGGFVEFFQIGDITTQQQDDMMMLSALLDYFHVPAALNEEILSFYSHQAKRDVIGTYGDLFAGLPEELQDGMQLWSRLDLVQSVRLFDGMHSSARMAICKSLEVEYFSPEQYIIHYGDIAEEMFFLTHGFVDVLTKGYELVVTLRRGAHFGEQALLGKKNDTTLRGVNVKAISYCEVFVLSTEAFLQVIESYPRSHGIFIQRQVDLEASASVSFSASVKRPIDIDASPDKDDVLASFDVTTLTQEKEASTVAVETPPFVVVGIEGNNSNNRLDVLGSSGRAFSMERLGDRNPPPRLSFSTHATTRRQTTLFAQSTNGRSHSHRPSFVPRRKSTMLFNVSNDRLDDEVDETPPIVNNTIRTSMLPTGGKKMLQTVFSAVLRPKNKLKIDELTARAAQAAAAREASSLPTQLLDASRLHRFRGRRESSKYSRSVNPSSHEMDWSRRFSRSARHPTPLESHQDAEMVRQVLAQSKSAGDIANLAEKLQGLSKEALIDYIANTHINE